MRRKTPRLRFLRLAAGLFAAAALSGCMGCLDFLDFGNGPKNDPGPGNDTATLFLARLKTVSLNGTSDTAVTAFTYDAQGMKVRERFTTAFPMVFEYDSLGRYKRWIQPNTHDTVETAAWITPDSSARGTPGSSLITRERWFGLRANCRCADSVHRYAFDGSLLYVRRFTFSGEDIVLVTRDWAAPARRDTAQRYANTYAGGRLASRIAYDAELEDTTRQFFVYEPLDSLIEER